MFNNARSTYTFDAKTSILVHINGYGPGPAPHTPLGVFNAVFDFSLNCLNSFFTQLSLHTRLKSSTSSSLGAMYVVPSGFSFSTPVFVTPSFLPYVESIILEVKTLSCFWSAFCSSCSFKFTNLEMVC